MNTETIAIRDIQHFLYCPHRWGLLTIGRSWAENYFVTKADLLHKRVHDPDMVYSTKKKKIYSSVPVYNDDPEYDLYGIIDSLEFFSIKDEQKVDEITELSETCIVEYKPTKPKDKDYNEDDLMQVFAQKICVDNVFGGDCNGAIYYSDVKKRIELPLKENFQKYDERLKDILFEMRTYIKKGEIPEIRTGQKCNGCSMKDLCLPCSIKKHLAIKAEIQKIENSFA